jgi:predicted solute-binding protein
VALQASIALHVAAALGGPAPGSRLALQQSQQQSQQLDAVPVMTTQALAALGAPQQLAQQYAERLRSHIHQPRTKELKSAFVAVVKALAAQRLAQQQQGSR